MIAIPFVCAWLLVMLLVASMAETRGRSEWAWALVAVLVGPLAILLVALAGTTMRERVRRAEAEEEGRLRVRERLVH